MSKILECSNNNRIIKYDYVTMQIVEDQYPDASFDVLVLKLKKDSHFSNYIKKGRYYHLECVESGESCCIWTVGCYATERFHNEGQEGAQFLLYWWKDSGFSIEIDS